MSERYDFLGVGGLAVDWLMSVDRLPIADDKYPARLVGKLPGGFIANATCGAGRLGLRSAYIGWTGDDADADLLVDDFGAHGVDPAGLVRVPGELTPFTVVITDQAARRAILLPNSPLYNQPLAPEHLALAARSRVVYTYPRDAAWVDALAGAAETGGGWLALDVESAIPLRGPALRAAIDRAAIVFIHRDALAALHDGPVREIVQPGQWIVMTGGGEGAWGIAADMAEPVHQPARRVKAVDTTGAGDCFHAALIAARLDGATLREALAFASAAAALKVQHRGARGGLPTRAEVEALLAT